MTENAGLHLYTSNRLELLADQCAKVLATPLRSALVPELVVVQTPGMERWLTQQLALRQGVCANMAFLFPQRLVAQIIDEALPGRASARFFSCENLTWAIMKILPALSARPEFAELSRYLDQPRPKLRLFQLAGKIAGAFDRYLAFRPGMILDWEGGAEKHWQAILWRELVRHAPGLHPPALAKEFSGLLRNEDVRLPERILLFGLSTLPPLYVEFLQDLADRVSLHLFLLRPTPQWWGDTRSAREEMRARRKASESAQLDLQFERGNPLLSSLGKLGRDFLEIVTELSPAQEEEHFQVPAGETMLAQVQRDIFELRDPTGDPARPIAPDDHSLQFHSCHSPMRETEVLHDQLLALFEQHRELKPHDIVVMAPDISVYAPFIEAVFATGPEALRIPYSIADRGARAENGLIDTFLRILELAGSRFTASSVLSILESVPLQRNFDLTEPDVEIIRTWIEKTGIRWGIDAAHRAELGLPEFGENSWRAGLDRLLLGYAAPAQGEKLFAGILAFDDVEGNLAETLGHFAEFAEVIFATARALQHPRTLAEWQEMLRQIAVHFFAEDDEREPELHRLRRVIDSLGEAALLSGFDQTVPLDVLLAHLEQALAELASGSGFLAGRITFCALKPMRTVPFRVVCLIGMNDTAYPRHDRPPAFDLVAQKPRRGDRNTRDDDRYLFLEALLSARDLCYVSHVGRSIRDNSPIPPSVLVSELREYSGAPVTEHPLQPFSRKYFTGTDGLFSYSAENCLASGTAIEERSEPAPFLSAKISEPEAEWQRVDNTTLRSFFSNPSKFFIRERLGLRLAREDPLLEEAEPLEPGGLAKYKLEQDLLDRTLGGEEVAAWFPVARAAGNLPPGRAGESHLRELAENARLFAGAVRENAGRERREPEQLQLTIGRFELRARIDNLFDDRLVRRRLTTRKPADLLGAWIDHLLMNCVRATESILITATKEKQPVIEHFAPPQEDARTLLASLLEFYWRGLREPLPFFPRSSLAFADRTLHPTRGSSPLEKAQKTWGDSPLPRDNEFGQGPEREDDYFDLAFRNVPDPLGQVFREIALQIFEPALKTVTTEK
ncbi:MAG TPA: exodeoxyribonuclease V subunit gamma [Chthoniobacterales bacterium]|nr:exodeoxyribonuclease V subunit gamma [Chthoniobacterales bacterium]